MEEKESVENLVILKIEVVSYPGFIDFCFKIITCAGFYILWLILYIVHYANQLNTLLILNFLLDFDCFHGIDLSPAYKSLGMSVPRLGVITSDLRFFRSDLTCACGTVGSLCSLKFST